MQQSECKCTYCHPPPQHAAHPPASPRPADVGHGGGRGHEQRVLLPGSPALRPLLLLRPAPALLLPPGGPRPRLHGCAAAAGGAQLLQLAWVHSLTLRLHLPAPHSASPSLAPASSTQAAPSRARTRCRTRRMGLPRSCWWRRCRRASTWPPTPRCSSSGCTSGRFCCWPRARSSSCAACRVSGGVGGS